MAYLEKLTSLLTKLFIASESPVRNMYGIPYKVTSNGFSIAIFTATISATWRQPASTAENSEEVFVLPILSQCNHFRNHQGFCNLKNAPLSTHSRSPFNGGVYADSFLPGILTLLPEIVLQIWLIV